MASAFAEAITASIVSQLDPQTNMVNSLGTQLVKTQELEYREKRKQYVTQLRKELRAAKEQTPVDDDEVAWLQAELNSLKG